MNVKDEDKSPVQHLKMEDRLAPAPLQGHPAFCSLPNLCPGDWLCRTLVNPYGTHGLHSASLGPGQSPHPQRQLQEVGLVTQGAASPRVQHGTWHGSREPQQAFYQEVWCESTEPGSLPRHKKRVCPFQTSPTARNSLAAQLTSPHGSWSLIYSPFLLVGRPLSLFPALSLSLPLSLLLCLPNK